MGARLSRIDALRGFAVFGILLVNIWGFVYGFTLHGYPGQDSGVSLVDQAAVFGVAAFAEQKFYPIFAFLFGAGFALQTGRRKMAGPALDAVRDTYRRRLQWLLVCGILHGSLLWFGDILTAYALTGFWLLHAAGKRLASLVHSFRLLAALNIVILLAYGAAAASFSDLTLEQQIAAVMESERVHAIYSQGSWLQVARMRLEEYGVNLFGFVIFLPRIALLFMLGLLAVRLGYLTRPHRHDAFWRKVMLAGFGIGLPLNLLWGAMSLSAAADPFRAAPFGGWLSVLPDVAGPLLGAGFVAVFMLAREPVAAWLVPVGRMALTNYLSQSVILMLLLQGFGLGLGATLSHGQLLAVAVLLMLAQLLWSRWWLASHAQGPMEAIWRRYTYRR